MRRSIRWMVALLLLLVAAGARRHEARAGDPPAAASEFVAPRGCWGIADGCPARTGASATPSIRGSVVEAWSWSVPADVGGVIEEEPRVWHDRVYVCVSGKGGRLLFALSALDGRPLLPPLSFASPAPLDPCVTDAGVLLRSGTNELRVVRPVDGRWATVWGPVTSEGSLDCPLLADGHVCARSATGLEWWRFPSTAKAASLVDTVRGRPAIARNRAWYVRYDEVGNADLRGAWLRPSSVDAAFLGHHGTQSAPTGAWATRIAVGPDVTLVAHGAPVKAGGGTSSTSLVRPGAPRGSLYDFVGLPAVLDQRWLGYGEDKGKAELRLIEPAEKGQVRWWDLASKAERPEFFRPELPITLTQGVAWVGTSAFDVATRRVTCRLPDPRALFRVVPAEGGLLVVPEGNRLVLWREDGSAPGAPVWFGAVVDPPTPAPEALEGRVLFADDTLYVGGYDIDRAQSSVRLRTVKGKGATRPLEEVLLLTAGTDRLVYAASLPWLDLHLARLAAFDRRDEALKIVRGAAGAQDTDLTEAALTEALARGVPEKDLAFAVRIVASLREKPLKVFESRQKEMAAKLAALQAPRTAETLALLASALKDPRPHVQRAILRLVLERKPDHPEAVALVRASLPAHVPVPEPFVAKDWIESGSKLAAIPTRPVDVPKEGARPLTRGERELGAARHYWREDLTGIESAQLLVMTSLKAPDRLAEVIALGELVCTALEDVFSSGAHVRTDRWPLILQLFETEQEYRRFEVGNREPEGTRAWSAGHYDPQAGVSRIFVPAGDQGLEDVRTTYTHELAHHWIQERCPLFEPRDAKSGPADVVWIVEGMAVLVESFTWNVPERRWETFVPDARCLDVLAGAPPRTDWTGYFDIQDKEFERLSREDRHKVGLRNLLGHSITLNDLSLFYATSGAVCEYLFHAGPKERAALLAYVRDAYTGNVRAGTPHIKERFGMSPEELGRKAVEWARGVTEGRIQRKDVFLK